MSAEGERPALIPDTVGLSERYTEHDTLRPVLIGAAVREGRALTVQTVRGACLPGGKAELGETRAEALTREIAEETGMRVTRIGRLLNVDLSHKGFVCFTYAIEVEGEPVAGSDALAAGWATPDELPERDASAARCVLREGV